ncbi:MAG: cache domain-containing protein [Spirochaetia bacterium]|nr:cache domain-containing protein [Spirochaetia bacterium]
MKHKRLVYSTAAVFSFVICYFVFFYNKNPRNDLKLETFSILKKIRKEKKEEINRYFNEIKKSAINIKDDEKIKEYFLKLKEMKEDLQYALEIEIDNHYVKRYGNFYDILFISPDGFVFHSIKKESDYKKNVFEIKDSKLRQIINNKEKEIFIDYEYYGPSDEPAAFYSVPVTKNSEFAGWFVLQSAVNTVSTMLSKSENLGQTGEVYLVNQDKLMLSESRFLSDSTILKLKVDTEAVKEALKNGSGEKIIKDYRGVNVFSSFEKFSQFNTNWIILVEIDEDEIITRYYKEYKPYLKDKIIENLKEKRNFVQEINISNIDKKRVDINEFIKANKKSLLYTQGVSTCTSLSISYPDNFGYLAHITPLDEIYYSNKAVKYLLAERSTDFIGQLLRTVKYYDIYASQLNKLKFVITATHAESFEKAIDKILDNQVFLSQIKFAFNSNADRVNIYFLPLDNKTIAQWQVRENLFFEDLSSLNNLSEIVKKIIQYDKMPANRV